MIGYLLENDSGQHGDIRKRDVSFMAGETSSDSCSATASLLKADTRIAGPRGYEDPIETTGC